MPDAARAIDVLIHLAGAMEPGASLAIQAPMVEVNSDGRRAFRCDCGRGGSGRALRPPRRWRRLGSRVVVLERGQFPGAKNVWGGILYREPTEAMAPGFEDEAPLERPIIEQRYMMLTGRRDDGRDIPLGTSRATAVQRLLGAAIAFRPMVCDARRKRRGRRSTPSSRSSICSGKTAWWSG